MLKRWRGIAMWIFLVCFIICFVFPGFDHIIEWRNPCIKDRPLVAVDGDIRSDREYYLFYKGKCKRSEEYCKTRVRVTKFEYERVMYGREN